MWAENSSQSWDLNEKIFTLQVEKRILKTECSEAESSRFFYCVWWSIFWSWYFKYLYYVDIMYKSNNVSINKLITLLKLLKNQRFIPSAGGKDIGVSLRRVFSSFCTVLSTKLNCFCNHGLMFQYRVNILYTCWNT